MSEYDLSASQVLKRTDIDLIASAGTKTVRGIKNLDVFSQRDQDGSLAPQVVIASGAVLGLAVLAAAIFFAMALIA